MIISDAKFFSQCINNCLFVSDDDGDKYTLARGINNETLFSYMRPVYVSWLIIDTDDYTDDYTDDLMLAAEEISMANSTNMTMQILSANNSEEVISNNAVNNATSNSYVDKLNEVDDKIADFRMYIVVLFSGSRWFGTFVEDAEYEPNSLGELCE